MKKKINTLMSLTLLAFCFAFTAQAQVVAANEEERSQGATAATVDTSPIGILSSGTQVTDLWVKEVDRQYAAALKETDAPTRVKALQDIIFIATRFGDTVPFEKAISPLLGVYMFDKNKNHRLMALSALHAIGDAYGMQRLRELVNDEPSEQVRRLTHRALADYYGPKS